MEVARTAPLQWYLESAKEETEDFIEMRRFYFRIKLS